MATVTDRQRGALTDFLLEGNTKEDLINQLIAALPQVEVNKMLDHIDLIGLEEDVATGLYDNQK